MVLEHNKSSSKSEFDNFLFIISAPSGTGKTTICRYLLGKFSNLKLSISATTREPRKKEENGVDYFFITKEQFEKKITDKQFLEYAKVFNNYYGTPINFVKEQLQQQKNVLFDIDWQGTRKIKEKNEFNITTLFLVPPSIDILRSRLEKRGDSKEKIEERIGGFKNDAEKADEYDYVIINDDLNRACFEIENIYRTECIKMKKNTTINFINNSLMK